MNRTKELKKIKNYIGNIIDLHEKMKKSYFWAPPCNASSRRSYEEYNSNSYENKYLGIRLECNTSCSCKNIYYSGKFYVNGKKTTILKIKNIWSALDSIC